MNACRNQLHAERCCVQNEDTADQTSVSRRKSKTNRTTPIMHHQVNSLQSEAHHQRFNIREPSLQSVGVMLGLL